MRVRGFSVGVCLVGLALAASANADDDCKAIVQKALKARGDADKIAKLAGATWHGKGTVNVMGQEFAYKGEWAMQAPDRMKMTVTVSANCQEFTIGRGLDAKGGWQSFACQAQELSDEEVAEMKENAYVEGMVARLQILGNDFTLTPLGDSKVDDKPVVGVKVSSKGRRDVNLYFDKATGLLAKAETRVKDVAMGQEFKQETLILEYKDAQGVKYPAKMRVLRDGSKFIENEISDMKMVEKLDESVFARP